MSSSSDQTERDRLQRQYSEIATLAGGLAHEVRNPISTIRMNLELLFEDVDAIQDGTAHRMRRKLEMMRRECGHLEEIVEAFLEFVRAGELHLVSADLGQLVAEFIEFYRPEAAQLKIDLRPHLASNMPPVQLDRKLMRQVLTNLTRNAQQAMPEGGILELQTYTRDNRVFLEIIDTGCGMTDEARAKMFQTFFSTKPGGSGLGLPTVRKIVEAHQGTIECDSEVGRGTRMTLSLPVTQPTPEPAAST